MPERTDFYRIRFDADPVQLLFFRHGLDRWLAGLDWPEAERIDIVLAVYEVCANAVQHAYLISGPGDVEVVARLVAGPAARHLVVEVRDHGQWRPQGQAAGLGLTAVRACMATVKIKHDGEGTVVRMTSRRVPLAGGIESDDGDAALRAL
jgi:anti-sigma regulatory factor (Ser/Thr protein kinase)